MLCLVGTHTWKYSSGSKGAEIFTSRNTPLQTRRFGYAIFLLVSIFILIKQLVTKIHLCEKSVTAVKLLPEYLETFTLLGGLSPQIKVPLEIFLKDFKSTRTLPVVSLYLACQLVVLSPSLISIETSPYAPSVILKACFVAFRYAIREACSSQTKERIVHLRH